MSESDPSDKLQQLEHRHVQLLDELDALNQRLEETLSGFGKTSDVDQQFSK